MNEALLVEVVGKPDALNWIVSLSNIVLAVCAIAAIAVAVRIPRRISENEIARDDRLRKERRRIVLIALWSELSISESIAEVMADRCSEAKGDSDTKVFVQMTRWLAELQPRLNDRLDLWAESLEKEPMRLLMEVQEKHQLKAIMEGSLAVSTLQHVSSSMIESLEEAYREVAKACRKTRTAIKEQFESEFGTELV